MSWEGEDVCTNFAVAKQFERPERVLEIRSLLGSLRDGQVTRRDIDEALGDSMSDKEAAALFTCLVKNGAATQRSGRGVSFADNIFHIQTQRAASVLTQQVAVMNAEVRHGDSRDRVSNEFVATLPEGFEPSRGTVKEMASIAEVLRSQVFSADHSVRIANPYFDPSLELVDDLASLPQRGIETKILTRETSTSDTTRDALNRMWTRLESGGRNKLGVADLYERDHRTGRQVFATHAKMLLVDTEICYVGSANLTDNSLFSNFEFGVLVEGEIVEEAVELYDDIFDYARDVELPLVT
jgi:cardiolipin synthase/putative cardiolipin synthase